jgi:hypothetical protein
MHCLLQERLKSQDIGVLTAKLGFVLFHVSKLTIYRQSTSDLQTSH